MVNPIPRFRSFSQPQPHIYQCAYCGNFYQMIQQNFDYYCLRRNVCGYGCKMHRITEDEQSLRRTQIDFLRIFMRRMANGNQ